MDKIKWEVGGPQAGGKKVQHIPALRNNPNSSDKEKESVRLWNIMVNALRENGLMKEKGEE